MINTKYSKKYFIANNNSDNNKSAFKINYDEADGSIRRSLSLQHLKKPLNKTSIRPLNETAQKPLNETAEKPLLETAEKPFLETAEKPIIETAEKLLNGKKWRIKTEEEYQIGFKIYRRRAVSSLEEAVSKRKVPETVGNCENNIQNWHKNQECFLDFLKGLLELDPKKRWSAAQALLHPFITEERVEIPFTPPPHKTCCLLHETPPLHKTCCLLHETPPLMTKLYETPHHNIGYKSEIIIASSNLMKPSNEIYRPIISKNIFTKIKNNLDKGHMGDLAPGGGVTPTGEGLAPGGLVTPPGAVNSKWTIKTASNQLKHLMMLMPSSAQEFISQVRELNQQRPQSEGPKMLVNDARIRQSNPTCRSCDISSNSVYCVSDDNQRSIGLNLGYSPAISSCGSSVTAASSTPGGPTSRNIKPPKEGYDFIDIPLQNVVTDKKQFQKDNVVTDKKQFQKDKLGHSGPVKLLYIPK
eukprot:GHVL01011912.1.p1 GENE.GHVL01011912.1~~GHVL01011912.1.p1  ORF type:complete len:470 (-),score=158.24 GHVL01011912.1:159-1568(-)